MSQFVMGECVDSLDAFKSRAISYLERCHDSWTNGYEHVRQFEDASSLISRSATIQARSSYKSVVSILGRPDDSMKVAAKSNSANTRHTMIRYWLRRKDLRFVNMADEDLTLRFSEDDIVEEMSFSKGTNIVSIVFANLRICAQPLDRE